MSDYSYVAISPASIVLKEEIIDAKKELITGLEKHFRVSFNKEQNLNRFDYTNKDIGFSVLCSVDGVLYIRINYPEKHGPLDEKFVKKLGLRKMNGGFLPEEYGLKLPKIL